MPTAATIAIIGASAARKAPSNTPSQGRDPTQTPIQPQVQTQSVGYGRPQHSASDNIGLIVFAAIMIMVVLLLLWAATDPKNHPVEMH